MHVIAISYARNVFAQGSRERARMVRYAAKLDSFTLIVLSRSDAHGRIGELHEGNFHAIATNSQNKLEMLFDVYAKIKKVLHSRKPDEDYVITSQDPFETSIIGAYAAWRMNVRHHIQVHGSFFEGSAWRRESLGNRMRWYLGTYLISRAHAVRVVSGRIKRSLVALGVPDERITVLPILADVSPFLALKRKIKKQTDAGATIVTVSRLAPEKNIPLIMYAVASLQQESINLSLRIVGSGPEHPSLKLLIHELGASSYISLVPWTNDVPKEMEHADIFALASNHEGYALVLIEAMAAGLPVVTTDVGCAGEVLRHDIEGLVVPVNDVQAFKGALRLLIENKELRDTFSHAGRKRAEDISKQSVENYVHAWVASLGGPKG